MGARIVLSLVAAVGLSALAQVALKAGMSASAVQDQLRSGTTLDVILAILLNTGVIIGLALYASSVGLWLLVLAREEVSRVYPFVGLGFLVTMAFACLFLGESFTSQKAVGTLLVALGVYVVANA